MGAVLCLCGALVRLVGVVAALVALGAALGALYAQDGAFHWAPLPDAAATALRQRVAMRTSLQRQQLKQQRSAAAPPLLFLSAPLPPASGARWALNLPSASPGLPLQALVLGEPYGEDDDADGANDDDDDDVVDDGTQCVVWLHGFPDSGALSAWGPQIDHFAAREARLRDGDDYYAGAVPLMHVFLDQRGYNMSAAAQLWWSTVGAADVSEFDLEARLAADVAAVVDAFPACGGRAHVVGHDWGGAVAHAFAAQYPDRTRSLVTIDGPNAKVFAKTLTGFTWEQLALSWYMFWFQIPLLPERVLLADDAEVLRRVHGEAHTAAELAAMEATWRVPGGVSGPLAWYRASQAPYQLARMLRRAWEQGWSASLRPEQVNCDALAIHGALDGAISTQVARDSLEQVVSPDAARRAFVLLDGAGHWAQHDQPRHVNALIESFLGHPDQPLPQ